MTQARKRYGRGPEPVVIICSILVLMFSAGMLTWLGRETVRHVTADTRPATVVSVDSHPNPFQKRSRRRENTISFELADGTPHSSSARRRLLWHPSPGDRVHVYEHAPGRWSIHEAFSWPRTIFYALALLLPWLFLLLKVSEKLAPSQPSAVSQKTASAAERRRRRQRRTRGERPR